MIFNQCSLDKDQPSPWNRGEGEPRKMIYPTDICPHTWSVSKRILRVVIFGIYTLLAANQFDFHGAVYVFVGVADESGSFTLDADAAFFAAICDGGSECTNATSVVRN